MNTEQLIAKIKSTPETVDFNEVMETIAADYHYQPCHFKNGSIENEAGTNEGSCKIFAFAKLHKLTQAETLACFGTYYRDDVQQNPNGDDHANIRNFMSNGWDGIKFEGTALTKK